MKETTQKLNHQIETGTALYHVVTANPEIVMQAKKDASYKKILDEADLITPDGIGIVLASRILKNPISERVSGYDLIHDLLKHRASLQKRTKVFAIGASEDVIMLAARKLRHLYPDVDLVGYHHGYFEDGSEVVQKVIQQVADATPDLLLIGLGSPRQERFIHAYKQLFQAKVAIGCGGTFDVLSGTVKRAPIVFQKMGLEWFYRLIQQPSRIKRQLVFPNFLYQVYKSGKTVVTQPK